MRQKQSYKSKRIDQINQRLKALVGDSKEKIALKRELEALENQ